MRSILNIRIIFVLLSLSAVFTMHCQTDNERMLFSKINEHRDSIGLKRLTWDTSAYAMAFHHAKYITLIKASSNMHSESIDAPGFEEMSFSKRCNKFILKDYLSIRENCSIVNFNTKPEKNKLTEEVFKDWFNSKEHKESMEAKDVKKGACSIQYYDIDMKFKTSSGEIKNVKHYLAIAVLNLY